MPCSELSQFRRAQQFDLDPLVRIRRRSGQYLASMRFRDLDRETLIAFVDGLDIPADEKERLRVLTPASYLGNAASQARKVRSE